MRSLLAISLNELTISNSLSPAVLCAVALKPNPTLVPGSLSLVMFIIAVVCWYNLLFGKVLSELFEESLTV